MYSDHIRFLTDRLMFHPQNIVEIILLAIFIFYVMLFIKGTRAVSVLSGFFVLIFLFFVAKIFQFGTITMIYDKLIQVVVIGFIVMFAPELRRALMVIGRQTFMKKVISGKTTVSPITAALKILVSQKTGALIAVKRSVGLRGYARSGVVLDSEITSAILLNIFFPNAPLHDGGVIIEDGRILAAACIFPLSASSVFKYKGTRHRAALGLSEETDALVICLSEETGEISLFENGKWDEDVRIREVSNRFAGVDV